MRIKTKVEDGRTFEYFESFWTGRRKLFIDGREIEKTGRKLFCDNVDGSLVEYTAKGSFLTGVSVISNKGERHVLASNKWYDWLLICLPFIGIPIGIIFCGALGAFLSVCFCMFAAIGNAFITRTSLPIAAKIPLQIVIALFANAIWFAIYFVLAVFILAITLF